MSFSSSARAFLVTAGTASIAMRAHAESIAPPSKEACGQAYERAQEQRSLGAYSSARVALGTCTAVECPAFIRDDCTSWLAEVERALPSVAFDVESDGHPLTAVTIERDGVPFDGALGHAMFVDPGPSSFEFKAVGYRSLTQQISLGVGERRVIAIELEPLPTAAKELPVVRPVLRPATRDSNSSGSPHGPRTIAWVPWILGGAGVAGLTTFAWFGLSGHADEAHLRQTCAPDCSDGQLRAVHAKYLIADVSLGIGLTSLALSSYWFVTASRVKSAEAASSRRLPVQVQVSRSGATANWSGVF